MTRPKDSIAPQHPLAEVFGFPAQDMTRTVYTPFETALTDT